VEQLVFLLDVTTTRIAQLSTEQVIERTGYGKYSIVSVPSFIRNLRGHGSGPAALSAAKSTLAIEKAALAKLDRQEREGSLVPLEQVAVVYARTFAAIKSRALALPRKIASRLAACESAVQAQQIIKDEVLEFLKDAEQGEVRFGKRRNGVDTEPAIEAAE
jgi:hypothetical protein